MLQQAIRTSVESRGRFQRGGVTADPSLL